MINLNIPDWIRAGMPKDNREATLYCFNRLVDFVTDGNNPDHKIVPSDGKTSFTVNNDSTLTLNLTAIANQYIELADLQSISRLLGAQHVSCEVRRIYTGVDGKPTHQPAGDDIADAIGLELCATVPDSQNAIAKILDALKAANKEKQGIAQTPQATITTADTASHTKGVRDKDLPEVAPSFQVP